MDPQSDKLAHEYIIASDRPILRLWPEKISRPVYEVLKSVDLVEVCVWNWGITEKFAAPTIVVVVRDK